MLLLGSILAATAVEERWLPTEPLLSVGDPWPGDADRAIADAHVWAVLPDDSVLVRLMDDHGQHGFARCGDGCAPVRAPDSDLRLTTTPPVLASPVFTDGRHLVLLEGLRGDELVISVWRWDGTGLVWLEDRPLVGDLDVRKVAALSPDGSYAHSDAEGVLWLDDPSGDRRRIAGRGDVLPALQRGGSATPLDDVNVYPFGAHGELVWLGVHQEALGQFITVGEDTRTWEVDHVDSLRHLPAAHLSVLPDGAVLAARSWGGRDPRYEVTLDDELLATSRQALGTVDPGWVITRAPFVLDSGAISFWSETPLPAERPADTLAWSLVEQHLIIEDGLTWRSRLSDRQPTDLGRVAPARWQGVGAELRVTNPRGDVLFDCQHEDRVGHRHGLCLLNHDDQTAFIAMDGDPLHHAGGDQGEVVSTEGLQGVLGERGRIAARVHSPQGQAVILLAHADAVELRTFEAPQGGACDTGRARPLTAMGLLLACRRRARP